MSKKDLSYLFLLASVWGASFLFIRVASPVLGPFLTIELRVLIAGICLLVLTKVSKSPLQIKKYWKQYMILGTLNAAIPFTLIATSAIFLNASMTSILNSLTPLFAVIVGSIFLHEKITLSKIVAIFLGVFGVTILVGWSALEVNTWTIAATLLSILATISYALSGVYIKRSFVSVPPLVLSTTQQLAAAIVLLPFTVATLPESIHVNGIVVFSVLALAIVCTAFAYLIYFELINQVGPTRTLSVTFLVPLFGTVWGMLFLQEHITIGIIVGLLLILSSIILISDIRLVPKRWREKTSNSI
ncbi:EamA/RhaT family transporter [Bacillus sp. HMF5848]|uniref:DMT family transporter n=1 Tax=Bacillus sp. HMF5848 TaxID=2495421 RepID=UPI000F7956E4|nr:DMT family transporter [Bacillus sp. HMF5848]RSK26134.1 EamA/RhaT family transporter [Bacillus sp. HMF5848]